MNNWILILLCLLAFGDLNAQTPKRKTYPNDWHLRSFERDSMYGAAVYDAYEYLRGRSPKRQVTVAIIDGGLDTRHEDLRDNLWTNPGEIPGNGIDDDRNGYVDDVHGWNFLGKADGTTIREISTEADRYFMALHERFRKADTTRLSPEEAALYHYYRHVLPQYSALAADYWTYANMAAYAAQAETFDRLLREIYPDADTLRQIHFLALESRFPADSPEGQAFAFFKDRWRYSGSYTWPQMFRLRETLLKTYKRRFDSDLRQFRADGRDSLGDNLLDVNDRAYGNPVMRAHEHGSHVAGIVGANRHNQLGMQGVADVRLMNLIVCTGHGDEYDKDLANAIRYAVDNGAQIINISLGRPVSMHPEWVAQALRHAEQKGVLVIHAAGNEGRHTNGAPNYPTRFLPEGKPLTNFINVGNSFADGLPVASSNFGGTEVDLFAPGGLIYSTITDDQYKAFSGTSMAAPVVAGVAALIWNYFPDLTADEVRQAILDGVTSRQGVVVHQPRGITALGKEPVLFDDLCATAGILNALGAVRAAERVAASR